VQGKRQLMRVVRTPDGRVHVDPTGKANGRGAYVHERRACWEKALHGRLGHALKIERLSDDDRAALERHAAALSDDPAAKSPTEGSGGRGASSTREAVT